MATKRSSGIWWPTALVLCTMLVAVTTAYVLVPDHRAEIVLAISLIGAPLLAYMRGILSGAVALALAVLVGGATSGCGPATGPAVLTALDLARKVGCETLCERCAPRSEPVEPTP